MGRLTGKVAVVTGAAKKGGLGRGIATRLAADGAAVVISDIGEASGEQFPQALVGVGSELQDAVAEITAAGDRAVAARCDVRDETQVEALAKAAVDTFGGLDIWVNNAGIGYLMQRVEELDAADWRTVLEVNLTGAFLGTKHAAQIMIARGKGGRIINIASQAAKSGFPFAAAYTASKPGMIGLTRAAAIDLGGHAITVNAVCPNHVTTPLGAWQNTFFADKMGMTEEAYLAAMRGRIPLGRPGLPTDIAGACAFLAGDDAVYITGEALNVSGGAALH